MNTTTKQLLTKAGKYGTLHLFRVTYDPMDPCLPPQTCLQYRYSVEHVYDAWADCWPAHDGAADTPRVLEVTKVRS